MRKMAIISMLACIALTSISAHRLDTVCAKTRENSSAEREAESAVTNPAEVKVKNVLKGACITWDPVPYADAFLIYKYRGAYKGGDFPDQVIRVSKNTEEYLDPHVEHEQEYTYFVKAWTDGIGICEGNKGNTAGLIRLETPEITAAVRKDNGVLLQWKATKGVSGYNVLYTSDPDFHVGLRKIVIEDDRASEALIDGLQKGETYYFRVQSYKERESGKGKNGVRECSGNSKKKSVCLS